MEFGFELLNSVPLRHHREPGTVARHSASLSYPPAPTTLTLGFPDNKPGQCGWSTRKLFAPRIARFLWKVPVSRGSQFPEPSIVRMIIFFLPNDRSASHQRHNPILNCASHWNESFVAAGPVSRILSAGLLPRDGHSSGPRIAARLKRPTRRFDAPSRHVRRCRCQRCQRIRARRAVTARKRRGPNRLKSLSFAQRFAGDGKHSQRQRDFLPIWSCSVWGLPCPRHCCRGGALLPHLFTLTLVREGQGGIFSVALSVNRA
jgi:hypothetical protein